jgi:hypothetical protein
LKFKKADTNVTVISELIYKKIDIYLS